MRPNHQGLLSDAAAAESSQIAQGLQRRRGIESTLSSLDEKSPRLVTPQRRPAPIPGCNLERPFSRMEWRHVRRRVW